MVAKARILGAGKIIALDTMDYKLNLAKKFGADLGINTTTLSDQELVQFIREESEGRGADVSVECVGRPDVVKVGLEMLRRGGTYLETGNFADTGTVELNIHRHIAAKNVLIYGNTNHPHDDYYSHFQMMNRYRDAFPFSHLIKHRFKYEQTVEWMKTSFEQNALKVVFTP